MDNSYFLKKSHLGIIQHIIAIYIIFGILLVTAWLRSEDVRLVIVLIVITATASVTLQHEKSSGLYISGTTLIYKNVQRKNIDVLNIAGIKVMPAYGTTKYTGFSQLKDSNGNALYSAIFLKVVTNEMRLFQKGDIWFKSTYKKQILCSTIYERSAIDYLKILNPNIELLM